MLTAQIAHSLLHPNEPGFAAADAATTKYPFDARRALALLEAAGWRRGSDGVLTGPGGERFEVVYQPEPVAIHRNLRNARPRPNSSGQHSTTRSVYQWEWA